MPVVKNEQDIKRQSQFLKYETGDSGNSLILKSHLYQIDSHFIRSVNRSVSCRGVECLYCQAKYQKRSEYNYMVYLNGQIGFMDIRASVFFAIQGISKAQKKDPRQISWTVIKTGSGLDTEYTTSKEDNLAKEDYDRTQEELDANTDKLVEVMEHHEEALDSAYTQYMSEIRDQGDPKKKVAKVASKPEKEEVVSEEPVDDTPVSNDPEQEVDPDDIPF